MKVKTHYGEELIQFELPKDSLLALAVPKDIPPVKDEEAAIRNAIDNPIGEKRLSDLVTAKSRVAIIVDDPSRPTPVRKILMVIFEELKRLAVPDNNITIVIGSGGHYEGGVFFSNEVIPKLGVEIATRYRWLISEPDRDQVKLGITSRGTPVSVCRYVANADVKIGVGSIFTHRICGYGGGAKIILPGVASRESIYHNHVNVALSGKRVDPNMLGTLENAVRLDMEEAARIGGLHMIINTVLNMATEETVGVVAGDFVKAHREGVKLYNRIYQVKMECADATIVSSYHLDSGMVHGVKAMCVGGMVTKKGGIIILVSPFKMDREVFAPGGVEYGNYRILTKKFSAAKTKEMLLKKEIVSTVISSASELVSHAVMRENHRVILVSEGWTSARASSMGYEWAPTIDKALEEVFNSEGKNAKVNVVTMGNAIVPLLYETT